MQTTEALYLYKQHLRGGQRHHFGHCRKKLLDGIFEFFFAFTLVQPVKSNGYMQLWGINMIRSETSVKLRECDTD